MNRKIGYVKSKYFILFHNVSFKLNYNALFFIIVIRFLFVEYYHTYNINFIRSISVLLCIVVKKINLPNYINF